jgi:adenylosuccinate lyase
MDEAVPPPTFRDRLAADPTVKAALTSAALDACFDPDWYLRNAGVVFERLGLA